LEKGSAIAYELKPFRAHKKMLDIFIYSLNDFGLGYLFVALFEMKETTTRDLFLFFCCRCKTGTMRIKRRGYENKISIVCDYIIGF
jgi:hypothetical protein